MLNMRKQALTMQEDLSPEKSLTLSEPVNTASASDTIFEALGTSFEKLKSYIKKNGTGETYTLPFVQFNTSDENKMRRFFSIPEGVDTKQYLQELGKKLTTSFTKQFPDYAGVELHFGKQDNLYFLYVVK